MVRMAQWAVIIPADRWATERLYHHDTVEVSAGFGPQPGDEAVLIAGDVAVALGRFRSDGEVVYVRRAVEAVGPGDAVRQFWSYVAELGPSELPALVWPSGNELAMQAFVLGVEANQDPEEDEDDD